MEEFWFSIDKRTDLNGLPYQFYMQGKINGEPRYLAAQIDSTMPPDSNPYDFARHLRNLADAIDLAYGKLLEKEADAVMPVVHRGEPLLIEHMPTEIAAEDIGDGR